MNEILLIVLIIILLGFLFYIFQKHHVESFGNSKPKPKPITPNPCPKDAKFKNNICECNKKNSWYSVYHKKCMECPKDSKLDSSKLSCICNSKDKGFDNTTNKCEKSKPFIIDDGCNEGEKNCAGYCMSANEYDDNSSNCNGCGNLWNPNDKTCMTY